MTSEKQITFSELRASLRGNLITRQDENYDSARATYNGMIDRYPAAIARCVDVADVIAAVNFARDTGLPLAIRGGGHSGPGLSTVDHGLVIDLSPMKGIHVDARAKTVRVEGGCVWGDVDHATHPFGMAVPCGFISTTGVGGLTLGGGSGYLSRKYGLTIDNLLSADVVLADGSYVTASLHENSDLFWALRGGGGNFGVVTSFLFHLCPVDTVFAGPMLWTLDKAPQVMRYFDDLMQKAPRELGGFFAFLTVPPAPLFPEALHLQKMCGMVWCYMGTEESARNLLASASEVLGPPALDGTHMVPFPALQRVFDPLYPPGLQWYWKADFANDLSDEAIARHVEYATKLPSVHSTMHLYPINGSVQDVGASETAFSYRDTRYSMVIVGVDPDPANADTITAWARNYWEAVHPYSAGGAYVNFMMEEGEDRIRATYRDNYSRLAAIKVKYDPDNLFHVNQNIKPDA